MKRDSDGDPLSDRIKNLQKMGLKYRRAGNEAAYKRCEAQIETLMREAGEANATKENKTDEEVKG